MPNAPQSIYLNLDDAWNGMDGFEVLDVRQWGPKLRYHGRRKEVEAFYETVRPRLGDFVLYGSGDFHYLAGIFLRRIEHPITVISFDNHPDWDIRPPYWSCGGWVNRALELPCVKQVAVWGCGNFELQFPSRLFANRSALRKGRLQVHAWAERQTASVCKRFNCMTRDNWRERFARFASQHSGEHLYITVDLDCLGAEESVTNWENGLFTAEEVAWAIGQLRAHSSIIAGDLCGAGSTQVYARRFQRFAARWDHPKSTQKKGDPHAINLRALNLIWPALAS